MSNDQLFQLSNLIVLPAWLLLILVPRWKWTGRIVISVVVTILSLLYVFLVFRAIQPGDLASFGSLDGVTGLFSEKGAVLAGWIHYLAFDLMTGWFIVSNAAKLGINRWLTVPSLLLTFMLGPSGLLLYLVLRTVVTKKYFVEGIPENGGLFETKS